MKLIFLYRNDATLETRKGNASEDDMKIYQTTSAQPYFGAFLVLCILLFNHYCSCHHKITCK